MRPVRSSRIGLVVCLGGVSAAFTLPSACSSDNTTGSNNAIGAGSSSSSGGSSSGGNSSSSSSGGGGSDGGPQAEGGGSTDGSTDGPSEAAGLGLLVDNMTAMQGTQIQLLVPPGETPGSYYTYSDRDKGITNYLGITSLVSGTSQLQDVPVMPAIPNGDGSQIVGELCFGGRVVVYAGMGMTLAYGNAPDATPESGTSSPTPFDASRYGGVSFYIRVDSSDASLPSIHFGIPDTQTADPAAWPTAACNIDGGACDDDFGSDVMFTAGQWTKVALRWGDLSLQGFGMPTFTAIDTKHLIGMKWQANGAGLDAGADSFHFCISDIYFTP